MKINLHNYEEFFLLYADDELTAQQREIVELFVAANPRLKKEFYDIQQTILKPDQTNIGDKSFLLNTPVRLFIDEQNAEERFVACHDGELTEEEQGFVHQYLKDRIEAAEAFELIGMARLTPDLDQVYADKKKLYKRSGRVVPISFVKVAAAAMLTGLVVWTAVEKVYLPQNLQDPNQQQASAVEKTDREGIQTPEATNSNTRASSVRDGSGEAAIGASEKPAYTHVAAVNQPENRSATPDKQVEKEHVSLVHHATLTPELPATKNNAASVIRELASEVTMADTELFVAPEEHTQAPIAQYASFASDAESDEYVLFNIPAESLRRSKVGILIKKVTRTIDRTNPINRLFNDAENE